MLGEPQIQDRRTPASWAAKPARFSIAIYIAAAAVRATIAFGLHSVTSDFNPAHTPETLNIARSLATTGSFANPFPTPTGYTAHTAPLYPTFLAGIYAVWGDTARGAAVRVGTSIAAAAAQYGLLPYVSGALGMGMWPGILAGTAGALFPLHYHHECVGLFETTWIALFLELSTMFFARIVAAAVWTPRTALLGGAWWAFGCLINPAVLPVLLGFLVLGLWKLRPTIRQAAGRLAVFAAAFVMVIAPWTIRNYVRLGGLFFIRDNFGLELFVSNYDGAQPVALDTILSPRWPKTHPLVGAEVARELARAGELTFYRSRLHQAVDWIRTHPRQFVPLTLRRIRTFWLPPFTTGRKAFVWTLTIAAFLGLPILARRNGFAARVLVSILVTYSAVYALVFTSWRYQHPVYWVLILVDGYLAWLMLERFLPKQAKFS
jgi:hypothetical protein